MLKNVKTILVPLFFTSVCLPFSVLMWYTVAHLGGSFTTLQRAFEQFGVFPFLYVVWSPIFLGSKIAWKMIALFAFFQLFFMKYLPGKIQLGSLTLKGNIPIYKANGPISFFVTLSLFSLSSFGFKLFSPTIIYDHLGELIGALNILSLVISVFLYYKGRFFPSSSDCHKTGNFFSNYYWGTELYPRILGWDVKMFTNCRFAMTGWAVILLSCAAKQSEVYGLSDGMIVSVLLQLLYIGKFFFSEMSYIRSIASTQNLAGFSSCWRSFVWIPLVYASPSLYLVDHPLHLGTGLSLLLFTLGASCIFLNYLADRQKEIVRKRRGSCTIWGKKPKFTVAYFSTNEGERRKTILLACGWWGISRHFSYVLEVGGAIFWSLPALFSHFLPYFYVVFLTILLVERAFREDRWCAKKYGKDWDKHCKRVPYKIIPYVL